MRGKEERTMRDTIRRPAEAGGMFTIGGDLEVYRLGFGTMRITGEGIWGPPANIPEAIATLRRALELGINLIDTADSYGPEVSELLIAEALYPYPKDLVIATKGGFVRPGDRKSTRLNSSHTEIYTLSLHDALPISSPVKASGDHQQTYQKPSQPCAAPLNWAST